MRYYFLHSLFVVVLMFKVVFIFEEIFKLSLRCIKCPIEVRHGKSCKSMNWEKQWWQGKSSLGKHVLGWAWQLIVEVVQGQGSIILCSHGGHPGLIRFFTFSHKNIHMAIILQLTSLGVNFYHNFTKKIC